VRVFENRVLRSIFGCKTNKVTGCWTTIKIRNSKICTLHQLLLEYSNHDENMGETCSMHGGDKIYVQKFNWKA
jgi:hypothetical protein